MSLVLEERIESKSEKALRLFWGFLSDFKKRAERNRQIKVREPSKEEESYGITSIVEGYLFDNLFYREERLYFLRQEQGVLVEKVSSQHYSLEDEETGRVLFQVNVIDGGLAPRDETVDKPKTKENQGLEAPRQAIRAVDYEELSWEEKRDFLNGLVEYYKKHPKRFSPKKQRKLKQLVRQEKAMDRLSKGFESLIYAMKNEYSELLINGKLVLNTKRNFSDLPALSSFIWECSQKYINS